MQKSSQSSMPRKEKEKMKLDDIINRVEFVEVLRVPSRFGWNYIIKTITDFVVFIPEELLASLSFADKCNAIIERISFKTGIPIESLILEPEQLGTMNMWPITGDMVGAKAECRYR